VPLLLERGPGGAIGEDDPAAIHLPGAEQLRPPRPLPAASRCVRGRRWHCGSGRGRAADSSARDAASDGEVAILLWVVVEPRQLCRQAVVVSRLQRSAGRGRTIGGEGEEDGPLGGMSPARPRRRRRWSGSRSKARKEEERAQGRGLLLS